MDKQTAIEHAGSQVALARLLCITEAAVSQWGDLVPPARVWQLKALRPEWFWADKKKPGEREAGRAKSTKE